MGSLLSCDQCYTREENSVIIFSDALVFRAIGVASTRHQDQNQDQIQQLHQQQLHQQQIVPENTPESSIESEEDWFLKIRAIDDNHSAAYGLSQEAFDNLAKSVEGRLGAFVATKTCRDNEVIDCYKQNPTCGMQCRQEAESFVDCVDLFRLKTLAKGPKVSSEIQKIK